MKTIIFALALALVSPSASAFGFHFDLGDFRPWKKVIKIVDKGGNNNRCHHRRCKPNPPPVPLPLPLLLFGSGLAGVIAVSRRKK